MSDAIQARYLGDGTEFVSGVPARSLTEADYDALGPDERLAVHNARQGDGQPLYQVRTDAEMHPAKAGKDRDKD